MCVCLPSRLPPLPPPSSSRKSSDPCIQGTPESLEQALGNLAKFDAVGIMERMDDSVLLLEAVLPRYFKGASGEERPRHARQNSNKRQPSQRSMDLILKLSALDIEFYREAEALLDARLKAALGSPARERLREIQSQGRGLHRT